MHVREFESNVGNSSLDGTSTWGKGADKGPELFLNASENMELYDIETQTEPYLQGVYLAGEVF